MLSKAVIPMLIAIASVSWCSGSVRLKLPTIAAPGPIARKASTTGNRMFTGALPIVTIAAATASAIGSEEKIMRCAIMGRPPVDH